MWEILALKIFSWLIPLLLSILILKRQFGQFPCVPLQARVSCTGSCIMPSRRIPTLFKTWVQLFFFAVFGFTVWALVLWYYIAYKKCNCYQIDILAWCPLHVYNCCLCSNSELLFMNCGKMVYFGSTSRFPIICRPLIGEWKVWNIFYLLPGLFQTFVPQLAICCTVLSGDFSSFGTHSPIFVHIHKFHQACNIFSFSSESLAMCLAMSKVAHAFLNLLHSFFETSPFLPTCNIRITTIPSCRASIVSHLQQICFSAPD